MEFFYLKRTDFASKIEHNFKKKDKYVFIFNFINIIKKKMNNMGTKYLFFLKKTLKKNTKN